MKALFKIKLLCYNYYGDYMNTTIYLIRHSIPRKKIKFQKFMSEKQLNRKLGLSEKGIKIATFKLYNPVYKNIDYIYSSEYLRAYETAKVLSSIIKKNIVIDSRFNERFHGKGKIESNYEQRQFSDDNYKLLNGESQIEVRNRMLNGIESILNECRGKKIAIFTHSTAITFLLKKWCDIKYCQYYKFNNHLLYNGIIDYVQAFKLEFENDNLINIEAVNDSYNEVEVGYLCNNSINYYDDLLKKQKVDNYFNTCVKDIYYSKKDINKLQEMASNDIKESCIRIRFSKSITNNSRYKKFRIQNYEGLLNIFNDDFYAYREFDNIQRKLIENGFKKVISTEKIDYQYMDGYLQLQDVQDIGLIVYYYNPKYFYESVDVQKKLLTQELKEIGFEFKSLQEIDRLKILLARNK